MSESFPRLRDDGTVSMVDVTLKPVAHREATAAGFIRLAPATLSALEANEIAKGNVLAVARIAGIQAAKQTAHLIPLCHPLPLSHAEIIFDVRHDGIAIVCTARTQAPTGVEMEALTGVSMAALTVYDMCKSVDPSMVIGEIRLISSSKDEPAD